MKNKCEKIEFWSRWRKQIVKFFRIGKNRKGDGKQEKKEEEKEDEKEKG